MTAVHEHTSAPIPELSSPLTTQEQEWVDQFMDDTTLFLGPDRDIMRSHHITSRSEFEDECIRKGVDPLQVDRIRKRLAGALDEGYEMCEAMGAAPGAKWGDLTTAIYTAAGDVTYLSCHGVIAFSAILHHPIRYGMKYWKDEPTVGINPGDGFIHNDARFGNVHNTDQSMIMPVMRNGQIIAWVAATIHEGENGACEPGGMPSGSETPFDDGLRMSPFKIVERAIFAVTCSPSCNTRCATPSCSLPIQGQNRSVQVSERVDAVIDEVGVDAFVAALRITVEDVDAEVRRRINELPDGTVSFNQFMDSTLKENILIKMACKIHMKGDKKIVDLRGTGPEILNRAINSPLCSVKSMMMQAILAFWWPDLPRCTSAMSCIDIISDDTPRVLRRTDGSSSGVVRRLDDAGAYGKDAVLHPGQALQWWRTGSTRSTRSRGAASPARRLGGQPSADLNGTRRRQAVPGREVTPSRRCSGRWPTPPSRRSWRRCPSCSWCPNAWSATTWALASSPAAWATRDRRHSEGTPHWGFTW
jgi:hypothetical protein